MSYLTGRTQSVEIHNITSKPRLLSYGVCQIRLCTRSNTVHIIFCACSKYIAAAWTDRSLKTTLIYTSCLTRMILQRPSSGLKPVLLR